MKLSEERIVVLKRLGPPNKYDYAPFGSLCYCEEEGIYYRQESKKEDEPEWVVYEATI